MSNLIKYEAACRALSECKAVDEVKAWADKAAAMQAYGRMAKDKTLEVDAAEIRIRAERRLGEMLAAQKAEGGLSRGAAGLGINQHTKDVPSAQSSAPKNAKEVPYSESSAPKLADVGISHNLSSRAQKLAAVPEDEFEAEVSQWRERVSAEGERVSARLQQAGEREIAKQAEKSDDDDHELKELRDIVHDLATENDQLKDRLAVEAMDVSEEAKTEAAQIIADLRERVATLERDNRAIRQSRDAFQIENAELKKQVQMLMRKLKKQEGRGDA